MKMLLAVTMLIGWASLSSAHAEWEILDPDSAASTKHEGHAIGLRDDARRPGKGDADCTGQYDLEVAAVCASARDLSGIGELRPVFGDAVLFRRSRSRLMGLSTIRRQISTKPLEPIP